MKSISLLALLLASTSLFAQDTPALRITWPENPPSENVQWYIVNWASNTDVAHQNKFLLTETSETEYVVDIAHFGVSPGDTLCISIVAARQSERSEPSNDACILYEGTAENPVIKPTGLSKPLDAELEIIRR